MRPQDLLRTCPHCSAHPAPFQEASGLQSTGLDGQQRNWRIATCPACGGPICLETHAQQGNVLQVVPNAVQEWEVDHLPDELARDWSEATSVFRVGAYASAVVMCGRTLEASANRLNVEGKSLHQRIKKMLDEGLITQSFGEAMDYVRLIRNTGAHAGAQVSRESAEGTMRFTQQALRLLFEVPGELSRLRGHPPELDEPESEEPSAA